MTNRYWAFKALSATQAEMSIYGVIEDFSFFGDEITPEQVKADLDALGPGITDLTVYINSPGGRVFSGLAIYNMLVRHPARVTTVVDGLAASIASVIAQAGDTVRVPRNATMMIHNPMNFSGGDARAHRKMADVLDTVKEGLVSAYMTRWGGTRAALLDAMDAETWYSAEQAVSAGLADEIDAERELAPAAMTPGGFYAGGLYHDIAAVTYRPKESTRTGPSGLSRAGEFRALAESVAESVEDLAERTKTRHANRMAGSGHRNPVDLELWESLSETVAGVLEVLNAPTAQEKITALHAAFEEGQGVTP